MADNIKDRSAAGITTNIMRFCQRYALYKRDVRSVSFRLNVIFEKTFWQRYQIVSLVTVVVRFEMIKISILVFLSALFSIRGHPFPCLAGSQTPLPFNDRC